MEENVERRASEHSNEWDVFVCHASEDKAAFARPLAQRLQGIGFKVWLDDWCLEVGDSLAQSIEVGLQSSRYGIVVLSPAFLSKKWPRQELSAMLARESTSARVVLPVWYGLQPEDVRQQLPLLADRVAARAEEGFDAIVDRLARVLTVGRPPLQSSLASEGYIDISWSTLSDLTRRLFPDLEIDEFWQTQLLADLDNTMFRSIHDIERAVSRARDAVMAYASERPGLFRSGTDYITKSLGFVDLCFRSRHNWAQQTLDAFEKHGAKVRWASDDEAHNPGAAPDGRSR